MGKPYQTTTKHNKHKPYELGQEGAAVLLPDFAII